MKEFIGIKLSGDLSLEALNRGHDDFIFPLLEKLPQGPGPFEPLGVDLDLFGLISCDDMVHGPNITSWVELDRMA